MGALAADSGVVSFCVVGGTALVIRERTRSACAVVCKAVAAAVAEKEGSRGRAPTDVEGMLPDAVLASRRKSG